MIKHLGPLELDCDAPVYSIVRACRQIGIENPEDVRWCRLSHRPQHRRPHWWELLYHRPWKYLFGLGTPFNGECCCAQVLPGLGEHRFTFSTGEESTYLIGQCRYCHTVYWEEIA